MEYFELSEIFQDYCVFEFGRKKKGIMEGFAEPHGAVGEISHTMPFHLVFFLFSFFQIFQSGRQSGTHL